MKNYGKNEDNNANAMLLTCPGLGQMFNQSMPMQWPQMRKLEVDEETIKNKLERLNVFKSVGPDGIHPIILKEQ